MPESPQSRSPIRRQAAIITAIYLFLATLWILVFDRLLNRIVHAPLPFAGSATVKGLLFVVVSTLTIYLLLRAWPSPADTADLGSSGVSLQRQSGKLLALPLGLSLIVPVIGVGSFLYYGSQMKEIALIDLRAVADLQADQLEYWLEERRANATMLAISAGFIDDVAKLMSTGDLRAKQQIVKHMETFEQLYHYDGVELMDVSGHSLLAEGQQTDRSIPARQTLLTKALASGEVQSSDLYRDSSGHIRLDLVAPLCNRTAYEQQAIGAAVLRAPAERFLYPLTQLWPASNRNAETLLARRDSDAVLFLNLSRSNQGDRASYRLPLDTPGLAVAVAALSDKPRTIEGPDYQGIPVLAAMRPIQGSAWQLVVKIDRDAVLLPLKEGMFWLSLPAMAAVAALTGLALLHRRPRHRSLPSEPSAQAAEKDRLIESFRSEQKRAECALIESEARFQALVEISAQIFWTAEANGSVVEDSPSWRAFTGRAYQEWRGFGWLDAIHPDDRERTELLWRQAVESRNRFSTEYRIRHISGEWRWTVARAVALLAAEDCVRAWVGINIDITERKAMEEALHQQAKLLNLAHDPILVWTIEEGIMVWNRGCEHLYGYTREQALGQSSQLLLKTEFPISRSQFESELEKHRLWSGELRQITRDGREVIVSSRQQKVEINDCWFVLEANRDITERKRSEEQMRRLNAELEERVRQRTAQLEAANKELETFAYTVSHDLKAPLRGIDGYSQLLSEDYAEILDDEGRTFLRNIRNGTRQMSTLIDDLLAYSRMERQVLQHQPIDVNALVKAVLTERNQDIREFGAVLRVDLPPLKVCADLDGLAMVLRNLLENALKFSHQQTPPVIAIGGRQTGDTAILWIRDNGIGFAMKFHDRIFDIFQRLQRSEDYPGTGIGLALVRKAMQRMEGRVWAESIPGQGATFFLELPL